MQRLYVSGYTHRRPSGVMVVFAPGVYNIDDEELAERMLADGVAKRVDTNDEPIDERPVEFRSPELVEELEHATDPADEPALTEED